MKFEFVFQWNSKFQNPGVLTTAHGAPIGDKTNSMSVGPRGTLNLLVPTFWQWAKFDFFSNEGFLKNVYFLAFGG